jgi:alpha-beta hydrolase superfamily lysophospholipase
METIEHIIQQPAKRTHKTPLLFQHGAWHGAWCWQLWIDYFASLGYEVHAISLPGHGKSSFNKKHINLYTLKDYVETLASQAESISPKPVVIGHSLGGAIVQKYLQNHQLPGAILLSTLPSKGMLPMILRLIQRHPLPALSGLLTWNVYEWARTPELAQDLFLNSKTGIDAIEFQKKLVREATLPGIEACFPFAKINPAKTPVLVVGAEKDNIFTVEEQESTAKKYNGKSVIIKNEAHNLMMESSWQQTANVIDNWIANELELP